MRKRVFLTFYFLLKCKNIEQGDSLIVMPMLATWIKPNGMHGLWDNWEEATSDPDSPLSTSGLSLLLRERTPTLDELLLAFLDCCLCGIVVQRCRVLILCSITAAGGGREGTLVCKLDAGHSTCRIGSVLQWVLRTGFLIPEMSNLRLGEVKQQPLWIT